MVRVPRVHKGFRAGIASVWMASESEERKRERERERERERGENCFKQTLSAESTPVPVPKFR